MKITTLLIFLMILVMSRVEAQEICDNGTDDDNDGLVDLLDTDCRPTVYPLIKNPSFEKIFKCPFSYSQLQYANYWMQPSSGSAGSTDLYHKCGECAYQYNTFLDHIPMPVPDGVGFAGFFDARLWLQNGFYKEHLTTCIDGSLYQDSIYVLEFYLGFMNPLVQPSPAQSYYSFSPVSISLFGHPSCTSLPYGHLNDTAYKSCPMSTDPQWVELAKISVTGNAGQWVKARAEFKSTKGIKALVIGPSCERSPYGLDNDWGFYLIDQVLLYKKEVNDIPKINRTGNICTDTVVLSTSVNLPSGSFSSQWYRNGIALPGEINPQLLLTRNKYGEGDYSVLIRTGTKTFLSPEATVTIDDVKFKMEDTVSFCGSNSMLIKPQINNRNCLTNYLWQDGSTDTTLIVTNPGIYWFQTEKDGCKRRDSIVVITQPSPVVKLGADTVLCPNGNLLLDAGNPGLKYQWQDNSAAQTLSITTPGKYFVKVSNNYCASSDTIVVAFEKFPSVVFSNDSIICEGEQRLLDPEVYGNSFSWSTGATTPAITVSQEGNYILHVKNDCGTASGSIKIIKDNCQFYMPSAFTPNDDGLNDDFGIVSFGFIKRFDFQIFNRWGQSVFSTSNPALRWSGSINGKKSPTGIYVWMVTYTDWRGKAFVERGTVALIR